MAQINTIIVLRNDQTTNWEKSSYKLLKGEVGIGYLANGNVIAKLGDGEHTWTDLPQIEGVFEKELILTHDFGRYKKGTASYVETTDAKGMTTSQWLEHALSEVMNSSTTHPSSSVTVSATGAGGEIGSYLTALTWDGTTSYGSYTWGTTGLNKSNSATFDVSNSIDDQKATTEDGTFNLGDKKIQLTQEASKSYAQITYKYKIDATNANYPLNNVGKPMTTGKVNTKEETLVKDVNATAYRKPFWGWKSTAEALADPAAITPAQVRALPNDSKGGSGTSTAGLPTSIKVPAGTKQVYFAAKAGTKSSLTVKNVTKEPATGVACTKKANAVAVEGANGFTATNYDLWYIDLDAAFTGETTLSLTWA